MGVGVCVRANEVAPCAATLRGTDGGRREDSLQGMVLYGLMICRAGFVVGTDGLMPRYGIVVVPVVLVPCATSLASERVRR